MIESRPEIVIVVAMTAGRVIGRKGRLPWRIPEELERFRELTTGHILIMGRVTYGSIGRPLPERRNIVVSRSLPATAGVEVCRSFSAALEKAAEEGGSKAFVIGGREIYRQALPVADAMVISWVKADYPGDVCFPEFDLQEWSVEKVEEYAEFDRVWYRRRKPPEEKWRDTWPS